MHRAVLTNSENHREVVKLLMEHRPCQLVYEDESGWTPTMYAVYKDHWEMVDLMLGGAIGEKNSALFRSVQGLMTRRSYGGDQAAISEANLTMATKLIEYIAVKEEYREQLNGVLSEAYRQLTGYFSRDQQMWEWFLKKCPELFKIDVRLDIMRQSLLISPHRNLVHLKVSRTNYLDDLFKQKGDLEGVITKIICSFNGEPGAGPGVTREFFSLFGGKVLENKYFKEADGLVTLSYLPAFKSRANKPTAHTLDMYQVIGKMMALSVLEGHVIGLNFAPYIIKFMIGGRKDLWKDFEETEKDMFVAIDEVDDEGFRELNLPLMTDVENPIDGSVDQFPMTKAQLSGTDGSAATAINKRGYMVLYARTRFYDLCQQELEKLKAGWESVFRGVKFSPGSLFNAHELSRVLSGARTLNMEKWRKESDFLGSEEYEEQFWSCVSSLSEEDRLGLLQFVTGLCALPPAGFTYLPGGRFTVLVTAGNDDARLPSATTCNNRLSLPKYSSEQVLKAKLLSAIRFGAKGFSFT